MEPTALALVRGALVRWTRGSGYAVVQAISDQRIVVRWDEERHDHPTTFTAKDPPLVRVDVKNGHVCRRRSTDQIVVPQETVAPDPPVWRCLLLADDSPYSVNIEEADLRPIPITNPIDRVAAGKIGSLARYRLREVTRWYRTQHFHDDLVSLGETGVDLKPHQVSVVHRVVANYPHRFLLCDEVGLGKTIEAGAVVKELRARRVVQRVLAIVPPNLVRQWQFEMKTKFNEVFAILNFATVGYLQDQGKVGNPFLHFDCVLCSSRWVESPKWAKLCAAVDWDLVIVDEAHHARHQLFGKKAKSTRLYRLVQALSPPEQVMRRGMLFLTATPLQLHTHELYSLIELLDPALFPSEEHFDRHRASLPGLGRLVEYLSSEEFPVPDEDPEMTVLKIAAWLDPQDANRKCELVEVVAETIAHAGLDVDGAIQRIHEFSPDMSNELQSLRESASRLRQRLSAKGSEMQRIAMELSDRHLLSEILIRNRKATVGGFMPRSAHRWEVGLSAAERRGLEAVEEYVQHGFQLADSAGNRAVGFVMVIFQKLMASSIAAVREALRRRRLKVQGDDKYGPSAADLESRLDDDRDTGDIVGAPAVAANGSDELRLLDRAIDILKLVTVDSKAQVLVERLDLLFRETPDEKVLLFTEFRETQRHLHDCLRARKWNVNLFHGQMKPEEKDRSVMRFREGKGPQILISTESGGEGRNFQFCHVLVNYDLPWNPMRVEQRIGRVDRIGQDHPVIICNLWVKGTVEERVLDVLEHRIRLFEETVGGLDPILGDTETEIRKILRRSERNRNNAFDALGSRLEREVRDARSAGQQLRDFVMDTKSFRKDIVSRISGRTSSIKPADRDRFFQALLVDERTTVTRTRNEYELEFRGEFYDTHQKTLFPDGRRRTAVFRPDHRPDSEKVELMAFGHPVIEALVARVLDERYEGSTGTRRIPAPDDLTPVCGWLFTYLFTVSGVHPKEEILHLFVNDEGVVDEEVGRRIAKRAARFDARETEIPQSEVPIPGVRRVADVAESYAEDRRRKLRKEAEHEADTNVDREIGRLGDWFDYRERAARDRARSTQATLERLRRSVEVSDHKIVPVWQANLRRDEELLTTLANERDRRFTEIESLRQPSVTSSLKSLGRVEIVAVDRVVRAMVDEKATIS